MNLCKTMRGKLVNVVTIRLVRGSSLIYKNRKIGSPSHAVDLVKKKTRLFIFC
ncbi:hypothetical protein SAMN02745941_04480 [Clostridium intestinale DSM 6191]|uniref:Uncharacterized protein n=1 Tax=Clostridium intestinale DSM 6191 TaxID=1121320 RepID=A0A1M6EPA4_9CLOT|nr:hypothetical protein SAMN02745941_04480 [Clostridium intestinale DSM 6191]